GFRPVAVYVVQYGIDLICSTFAQNAHAGDNALAVPDAEPNGLFVLDSSGGEKFPSAQRLPGSPYGGHVFPFLRVGLRNRVPGIVFIPDFSLDNDAMA